MRVTPRLLILAGVAVISLGVVADTIPAAPSVTNYFLGSASSAPTPAKSAAAIEKPQAVNGALYAVIAPTYNGTGGTSSYIRLFNGGAATATFSITVVGSPSGTTYGTVTLQVPTRASPQYTMADILTAAGAAALSGSDSTYSFYVQSTEPTAGYQHVTFNTQNLFFENNSSCRYALNHTIASVVNSAVLLNVHTSLFPTYPSQVEIHNYSSSQINYTAYVIEAKTGAIKGTTTIPIGANASYVAPFTNIQAAVGWTAGTGELHANLVITDPAGVAPAVQVGQSIINQSVSNALVNMSAICAVNAPVVAATGGGGDGGGFGGGGISY